jgi:MtrB/PioB family decaheme-associated outer membrane protein
MAVGLLFLAAPPGAAAEGLQFTGSIGLGLRNVNTNANDPSKANEYRDLSSGVLTNFDLRGRGDQDYINIFGENLGFDDQYFDMSGGRYDAFKYQLYSNSLRHNFGSGPGALSPFSGIGSSTLTAVFPNTNTNSWNNFDNSVKRVDTGGMFEVKITSPWYFRVDANEVQQNGTRVMAGALGTSPGNGFAELPMPVDYTTRNTAFETGYQSKVRNLSVNVLYSEFSNGNDRLRWSNGFFAPGVPTNWDTSILPQDNQLWKLSLNANERQLPGNSTLAGRVTYSRLNNSFPVLGSTLAAGNTFPSTNPSDSRFNGDIVDQTASLSLTSRLQQNLDTRVYWNWQDKKNNSSTLTFNPTDAGLQCSPNPCVPDLFRFKKDNVGVEGTVRASSQNRFTVGLDYLNTDRERVDFNETQDRRVYVEWKNSSVDWLTSRIRYQYLERRSNFVGAPAGSTPSIDAFVRRFDYANNNQSQLRLVLDASPAPLLDLGFEGILKKNDYQDTILGRKDDQRQEYYVNASYGDPKKLRAMIFGDIEISEFNSDHRVGSGNPDPSAPPAPPPPAISTTYNWSAKNHDTSWQVGIGADWLPTEKLTMKSSFIYARTQGGVDFTTQAGTILAAPLLNITDVDNTSRYSFQLKGIYKVDRNWDITAGYAFEKYRYLDIGYDGFQYFTPATPSSSTSYLTGEGAFQNYTTNIYYLMANYKF